MFLKCHKLFIDKSYNPKVDKTKVYVFFENSMSS